jgi:hypothetical protein
MFDQRIRSKKSKEVAQQKRKIFSLWFVTVFVVFSTGILILIQQPFMRVQRVTVIGNETIQDDEIEALVRSLTDKKKLGIFPRNIFLFSPKKKIERRIVQNIPRIENVEVSVENADVFVVRIVERKSAYLWCQNAAEGVDQCFYMDADSYVFARAPYFSDRVYIKFEKENTSPEQVPLLQKYAFDTLLFHQLVELRNELEEVGIDIYKIVGGEYNDFSLYINRIDGFRVNPEGHIRVSLTMTNDRILDNLALVFAQERFMDKVQQSPYLMHYVDLRFDNKVFFKFFLEENLDVPTLTE